MSTMTLLWVAIAALAVAAPAGTGARVLYEFSRRELEVYCRLRRRRELFGEILGQHDDVALGIECLYVLANVVFLIAGSLWMFSPEGGALSRSAWALAAAAGCATLVLLAVHLWIPWAVVRVWSAPFLFHTWRVWWLASRLMWPLTIGVSIVDVLARRLAARHEDDEDEEEAFEDEIRTIVSAGLREGLLEADAREMIEGVIELGDADVSDVMTPRSEVDAIDIDTPWGDLIAYVIEVGRTRIPVFENHLDNIIGILYVKDLLAELSTPPGQSHRPLREILRHAWSVPKTKPLDDLLSDFLRTRNHLAVVRDEYQSIAGVVTIEDVLEEIVGEIVDEWDDEEEAEILHISDSVAEVTGRAHLDDVNEKLGLDLPDTDDYDTMAGYLVARLGRIPNPGEQVILDHARMTILEATRRRIERVRIELLDASSSKSPSPG
ncbi:MAG: hemolysin family protein [Pirellulaceae bacterium]